MIKSIFISLYPVTIQIINLVLVSQLIFLLIIATYEGLVITLAKKGKESYSQNP